jgi:peptidyl-prolyl cis-trans isomerase B (cyclophilin B)
MDQAGLDVVGGIAAQGVDASDGTSPIAEARIESVTLG